MTLAYKFRCLLLLSITMGLAGHASGWSSIASTPESGSVEAYAGPGGSVRVLTNSEPSSGAEVELIATPHDLYRFAKWHDGNASNPRLVTISTNAQTYVAVFTNYVSIAERFEIAIPMQRLLAPDPDGRSYHSARQMSDGSMIYWSTHSGGRFGVPGPSITFRRISELGGLLWTSQLNQPPQQFVFGESFDHGLLIANESSVLLLDRLGKGKWSKTFASPFDAVFGGRHHRAVTQGADGNVWVVGVSSGKPRIQKVSPEGQLLWTKSVDFPAGPMDVATKANGSVLFYGSGFEATASWAAAFAPDGTLDWQQTFQIVAAHAISLDEGWLMGYTALNAAAGTDQSDPPRGDTDVRLLKLGSNGTRLRDASFGGSGKDTFTRFKTNIFGDWYILGASGSGPSPVKRSAKARTGEGSWVVKTDNALNLVWDFTFPAIAAEGDNPFRYATLVTRKDGSISYAAPIDPTERLADGATVPFEIIRISAEGALISHSFTVVDESIYPKSATNVSAADTLLVPTMYSHGHYLVVLTASAFEHSLGTPLLIWKDAYSTFQQEWSGVVSLFTTFPGGKMFYTTDGTIPTTNSIPYTASFEVKKPTTIHTLAISADGSQSASGVSTLVMERIKLTARVEGRSLTIEGVRGGTYQLERKASASQTTWEPVGGPTFTWDGFVVDMTNTSGFFRVKRL